MKLDLKDNIEEFIKEFSPGKSPEEIAAFRQGAEVFLQSVDEVLLHISTVNANHIIVLMKRIDLLEVAAFELMKKLKKYENSSNG